MVEKAFAMMDRNQSGEIGIDDLSKSDIY